MARQSETLHMRLGGNRTLVFGVVIVLLVFFSVDIYVGQVLGGGSRGDDYVRFRAGAREVTMDYGAYQNDFGDWQQFHMGMRTGSEDYLRDVMIAALAREAGLAVTDGALREFIRTLPVFTDSQGDFDPRRFQEILDRSFRGMKPRAFEEQARRSLLVSEYTRLYDLAYRPVNDEEAYRRWKADNQKITVAFAWSPVAPVREGMEAGDLTASEVEEHWRGMGVRDRHALPPRYAFEAAVVRISGVDDQAVRDYMDAVKDDPALALGGPGNEDECFDSWFAEKRWNFAIGSLPPETVDRLRKENEEEFRREEEERRKEAAPVDPNVTGAPPDLATMDPTRLPARDEYRIYWRRRIEREVFLRKVMEKVRTEAEATKKPLAEVAGKWSRPGVRIAVHEQEEPVDQYGPEKVPLLGGPNCPLRYALNLYADRKPEDPGTVHEDVLQRTASTQLTGEQDERGWCVFRVTRVLPKEIPPLDSVREAVVEELLDERARDAVRSGLEKLRRTAEDARRPLEEAAKDEGLETVVAGPFNAGSWRPPLPAPVPGAEGPPASERWKDPVRRVNAVMSRYSALRATPVGAFGPVLDDVAGTGAYYLAQTAASEDPAFEEMTQAQLHLEKRRISGERQRALGTSTSYAALKDRLGLLIGGEPAPAPEENRRR